MLNIIDINEGFVIFAHDYKKAAEYHKLTQHICMILFTHFIFYFAAATSRLQRGTKRKTWTGTV